MSGQTDTSLGGQVSGPAVIVIFGASGDLALRKLIPAFHTLRCENRLPDNVCSIGVARSKLTVDEFREKLYRGIGEYGRHKTATSELWPRFTDRLTYLSGDYDDPETYRRLAAELDRLDAVYGTTGNRLFYLAVPPFLYPVVVEQLGKSGLSRGKSGWCRIIIEKPFGRDLETARRLNEQVHEWFAEDQVYRIDHYLGKETVQNILTFRFANTIFEPLWNRNYVDHVQISMAESIGVGHRAGYYEKAGVVRDMGQNHLLQLLSLAAMEPPSAFNAKALRDEKVKVLQAVRPVGIDDGVWGQYRSYRDEPDVPPQSRVPTYMALKMHVDNWRWQGVPFYIRSGKYLARKATEIGLHFKHVPHLLFPDNADLTPNHLTLRIQPDEGVRLRFETKIVGAGMRTDPVDMSFAYGDRFGADALPDAYERLLLDALGGDASLFTRADEIEAAWAVVDPLLREQETGPGRPVAFYEEGSWGPAEADEFLARDAREWAAASVDDEAHQ